MQFYKIYVEITDICGLSCSFCTPKKANRGLMPLSLFKSIIEQISSYTKFVSLHVLGDPLCVTNLSDYLNIGLHYNVKFDIVSSGAFLEQKHFTLLTQANIHQVSFSLDALFNHSHLKKNIHQYIDRFIELHLYANVYAPKLYINLRMFGKHDYAYLLQRFPNAIMQIDKRRLRLAKNFFLRFHKPFTWHAAQKHNDSKCQSLKSLSIKETKQYTESKDLDSKSISLQTKNTSKHNKPYCFGAIKQLAILSNGLVVPCCIDANGSMPLGNLCVQDFVSILKSNAMQAMQKAQYTHENLPNLCLACTFRGV